jgi:hypothetical protein
MTIHLSGVKILSTGADGGHLYIRGRGEVPGQGEQDIYAYFNSKEEERDFERQFTSQSVIVEASSLEFAPSHSAAIRGLISWRFE